MFICLTLFQLVTTRDFTYCIIWSRLFRLVKQKYGLNRSYYLFHIYFIIARASSARITKHNLFCKRIRKVSIGACASQVIPGHTAQVRRSWQIGCEITGGGLNFIMI